MAFGADESDMTATAEYREQPALTVLEGLRQPTPVVGRQRRLWRGYLHKTSNSLCGIKGYASLIAAGTPPDPRMVRYARRILAEVEEMERIYASVQEMAFPLCCQPAGENLATVLAESVGKSHHRYPDLTIRLTLKPAGALLLPARDLELAVGELLANCAESRSEAGVQVNVRITTRTGSSGRVTLGIHDDGTGLPAELLAEAANPFVTTKPGHLGIGLARVDTIMDMHDLAWSLTSQPDKGTSVVMEVAHPVPPSGARRRGRKRK